MTYHPFFDGLVPTLHIAHRGGAGLAPENTIEACRLSIEKFGTQMLELDLQLTRDGVLVVAHDDTVDRCTDGSGRIADMTLREVQALDAGARHEGFRGARIPTLIEVLRAFPEMRLNVELKPDIAGIEHVLADTLRAENALRRVCCGSVIDGLAARVADVLPASCRFYPEGALRTFFMALLSGQAPPRDERWHVLDMPLQYEGMRLVSPPLIPLAHSMDLWINVWTVDDPEDMRELVKLGVGGIMTDRTDLLREVLG